MSLAKSIDALVHKAIHEHVFPGAVVAVARSDHVVHHAAYGTTTYDPHDMQPVALNTIYDVASLTKMFTATAALRLIDQKSISLNTPVQAILPLFQSPAVTVFHLLTHTSGLDIRLSTMRELGASDILAAVYATQPVIRPGSTVAYTNVNSLLLGEIVRACTGMALDTALDALVIRQLGLRDTYFCPPDSLRRRIAPTEFDTDWRGRLVHGSVHDESAHALGGVAGHAGLFSTADDLLVFCRLWLKSTISPDQLPEPPILSHAIACQAITNQTPTLNAACGLGWMIDRRNFMGNAPAGSFGHTGFTGPAMVCIPAQDISIVILSNRVHPRRGPASHHTVTAAIVAAALTAF